MKGNNLSEFSAFHIGIILDGNRRFAKKLMKNPWEGHGYGAETLKKLFDWLKEFNIRKITLYCLSLENLKRTKEEVNYLVKLFKKELLELEKDERLEKEKIKIKFIGKTSVFDRELRSLMRRLEEKTKDNKNY